MVISPTTSLSCRRLTSSDSSNIIQVSALLLAAFHIAVPSAISFHCHVIDEGRSPSDVFSYHLVIIDIPDPARPGKPGYSGVGPGRAGVFIRTFGLWQESTSRFVDLGLVSEYNSQSPYLGFLSVTRRCICSILVHPSVCHAGCCRGWVVNFCPASR